MTPKLSLEAHMSDPLEAVAQAYEAAAAELEAAAAHLHVKAQHFRAREVPRGCAHAWAATGHLHDAQDRLTALAKEHALKSRTE